MNAQLNFHYDREGDILYINRCQPYADQESEELSEEVIVRLNPKTKDVENVEILFFSTRLLRSGDFSIPLFAELKLAA